MRVLRVLREIRDGISELAGPRENATIYEVIDMDFIQTQTELGVYNWENCKHLVGGILSVIRRIQAPKRDAQTMERWKIVAVQMKGSDNDDEKKPASFCQALEFLLDRLNVLRIDAANSRCGIVCI